MARDHGFKVGPVDPVLDDIDARAMELVADQFRVFGAHGHDAAGFGKGTPFEVLEFPPLSLHVKTLEEIPFRLEIALPDKRIDVVGYEQFLRPRVSLQSR